METELADTISPTRTSTTGSETFIALSISSEQPTSIHPIDPPAATVNEASHPLASNSDTIADQGTYEGQAFLLDVSSHFMAPAAGVALTFSAFAARRPPH